LGKKILLALIIALLIIAPYLANRTLVFIPGFNGMPVSPGINAVVHTRALTSNKYDPWRYTY
jgi:hypothetical protein